MLMKDDKKRTATMIVSAPETEQPEMESDDMAHEVAAEEIMAAIEQKDTKALAEALKSFHEMCMNESE